MIEYPPLVRTPLVLDLPNVRVAAVATAPQDAEPRFPIYGYSEGLQRETVTDELPASPDWLPVRSLISEDAAPNSILLFEAPVMPPSLRRASEHGPRSSEALGGIAVNIADADRAHRMFDALGLRPRIHEEDFERLARINAGEIQVEREQETGV